MKSPFSQYKTRLVICVTIVTIVAVAYFWKQTHYDFVTGEAARERLEGYEWHDNTHQIRLVNEPIDAYLTRRQMIREAKERIDIATFLWRDDPSSRILFDDLIAACERGVRVRILSDGIFFLRKPGRVKAMAQAHENLEIRLFNPLGNQLASLDVESLDDFGWKLDNTNHRFHIKLFTTDGNQTLLGGRNIGDHYFGFADDYNFIDMDVLIKGSSVEQAETIFQNFWENDETINVLALQDVKEAEPESESGPDPIPKRYTEGSVGDEWREVERMAIWADRPETIDNIEGYQPGLLADRLAALVGQVEDDLLIATPYLVLSERSHTLLGRLRERNENLQLHFLTNSLAASDNWQTYSAFQAQLQWMLSDYRLLIHLKKPHSLKAWANAGEKVVSTLHTKAWVVDNRWSAIGSFNWDPRSEIFNSEVMAVFDDPDLAEVLRQLLKPLEKPENAWVVAERELPIGLEQLDGLTDLFNEFSSEVVGLRTWSLSNTACYEFVGDTPLSPYEEGFHQNFKSVGSFPEVESTDKKRVYSTLMEPLSKLIQPAL